jgi:hypothetical protein
MVLEPPADAALRAELDFDAMVAQIADSRDGITELFARGGRRNSTFAREVNAAKSQSRAAGKAAEVARRYAAGEARRRQLAEGLRKVAEAETAAMVAERDALFSGGDPDDPRFSRKGRDLIKALQNATAEGQLKRQLASQKRTHEEATKGMTDALKAALQGLENAQRLKELALARAKSFRKELKIVSAKLTAQLNKDARLAKAKRRDLPPEMRERVEAAEADTAAAEERAESSEEKATEIEKMLQALLKAKLGKETNVDLGDVTVEDAARLPLWKMLGKRCEPYSQDVIELGLTLMAQRLTAPQAVSVMRAFLRTEYPDKTEGVDYRVPSDARFREWRRYLEPICHFLSLSVIAVADRTHIMHDATTKHHIHIIQSVYRCEFHNADGTVTVLDVPLRFDVCPSGVAKAEAAQLKGHLRSGVGGGVAASWVNTASATSDNAARATNDEIAKLSAEEVAAIKAGLDAHVVAHPEELQHAVATFIKLTPAQQDHAGEMANLGCTGHSLNLTVDDSWQKSEPFSLLGNMVRDRAARVLQRLLNKTRGAKLIFKGYG